MGGPTFSDQKRTVEPIAASVFGTASCAPVTVIADPSESRHRLIDFSSLCTEVHLISLVFIGNEFFGQRPFAMTLLALNEPLLTQSDSLNFVPVVHLCPPKCLRIHILATLLHTPPMLSCPSNESCHGQPTGQSARPALWTVTCGNRLDRAA